MPTDAEVLQAGYEAWNRDDLDGFLEFIDPDIELVSSGVFPGLEPVYRGHEGFARFWRQLREPWNDFRIDLERVEEDDDGRFAIAIRFRGRGRDSGVEVDMRFGHAIAIRGGRATLLVARETPEEAMAVLRERTAA